MKTDAEAVARVQGRGIVNHAAILLLDDAVAARQHPFRIEVGEAAGETRQTQLTLHPVALHGALGAGIECVQPLPLALNEMSRCRQALIQLREG